MPVYVWELPVRMAHWGLVRSLVLSLSQELTCIAPLVSNGSRAWVMGWMRFIHEMSGFLLIAIFIPRIYWFFAVTIMPHGVRGFLIQHASGQASRAWLPITGSGAASPSKRLATILWQHSLT